MKRAGIITVPYYENFGSVLQAYALKTYLERKENILTDIIPFQHQEQKYVYFVEETFKTKYEEKKILFDEFRKNCLGIPSKPILEADLTKWQYDYYIAGSDQIWNPEITKLHPAYFLNFAPREAIKISYAASMALDYNKQTVNDEVFKRQMMNFDAVSIREKTHKEYIQQFTDKEVNVVLDPTLLLEAYDYNEIVNENGDMKEPYLLLYFLTHDSAAVDFGNMMAKRFGLKIIHYFADYPDRIFLDGSKNFAFAGPREFLGYVKNASLIFTNSFHGTVFSILFERPFYTFTGKRDMLSRVIDLTELLELEERRFNGNSKISELSLEIDFTKTRKRLDEEREKSRKFLHKSCYGEQGV